MKRDQALIPLSHDHQHALACALALKRATSDSAESAAGEFLRFWESEGRRHFRIEEEVLLPAFAEHADVRIDAVARVLLDHTVIRRDVRRVEQGARDAALLNAIGQMLDEHVRHEERVLFPMIEETLPAGDLQALAERIAAAER